MEELLCTPINSEHCGRQTWVKKLVQITFFLSTYFKPVLSARKMIT